MRVAQEEIFGPVTALIRCRRPRGGDRGQQQHRVRPLERDLHRDVNTAFRAMRDLDTGIIYINAGTIGAEIQLPFGGTQGTGNGHREAGTAALDTFTEWKSRLRRLLRQAAARPDRQPARGMRLTELHADLQTLREPTSRRSSWRSTARGAGLLAGATSARQEACSGIADDKKEHVARLLDLLRRLDVKQREKIERAGPPA